MHICPCDYKDLSPGIYWRNKFQRRARKCLISVVCLCAGCSGNWIRTVPVSGMVEYQGMGVGFALVIFTPKVGRRVAAVTDPMGEFQTESPSPDDGVPPGEYVVTVAAFHDIPAYEIPEVYRTLAKEFKPSARIPLSYADAATSKLTAIVRADRVNNFTFLLRDDGQDIASNE